MNGGHGLSRPFPFVLQVDIFTSQGRLQLGKAWEQVGHLTYSEIPIPASLWPHTILLIPLLAALISCCLLLYLLYTCLSSWILNSLETERIHLHFYFHPPLLNMSPFSARPYRATCLVNSCVRNSLYISACALPVSLFLKFDLLSWRHQ